MKSAETEKLKKIDQRPRDEKMRRERDRVEKGKKNNNRDRRRMKRR